MLLKLCVPAWRFFDGVEAIHVLEFRFKSKKGALSDWQGIVTHEKRKAHDIFCNARSNLRLAINSAIERVLNSSTDDEIDLNESKKTYQQLDRLVAFWIGFQYPEHVLSAFQFRIVRVENGLNREVFVSQVCGKNI